MPLLNEASKVYVGSVEADKIYLGSNLIWQKAAPPTGIVDQANLYDQWLAIDASTVGAGQLVSEWPGRVHGIPLSQTMDIRKPIYYSSLGGIPALQFVNKLMNTPRFMSPAKMTIYAKVNFAAAPSSTQTIACQDEGGNNRSWHYGVNPTSKARLVHFINGSTGISHTLPGAVAVDTWQILHAVRNVDPATRAGTFNAGNNGEMAAGLAIQDAQLAEYYMSVGGRGGYAELFYGYIAEVRMYLAAHDTNTSALVRAEMGI